ncbi:membrane dipeptidase [Amycolatopsis sp., V23-08]|uniref:Membrane dipeptidase n=1 Tax=Amycolatopsis heterodermiae TaxID=3110235 RepID=A0ABU5R9G4_9PSEU|nr:membrane dipeptidase [Amycolatopsis sp., V23-08]MEA5362290.1 membrane dipeptidase [Amycolatopsis sp., V23-08]
MNELHEQLVVGDAHNDLLALVALRVPDRWAAYFREHWYPQLAAGGVNVQVLPIMIDHGFRPEGVLRRTLRMIEAAHRIAEENADVVALCRSGSDIDAALAAGRIALVLALEGCAQIDEDVALLRTMSRLGVQMVSLTHFGRTALADGSSEQDTGSRLTRAGVAAIAVLDELGVLVDVSHLNPAGVAHVLELTDRPVIASHSAAFALRPHHRNLTDEQLQAIAATGGVICLNLYAGYLAEGDATVDDVVDHLVHIAHVTGEDHVGIGSDFVADLFAETIPAWERPLVIEGTDGERLVPGLAGPAGLPLITEKMLHSGLSPSFIGKVMGGNLLRLLTGDAPTGKE